LKVSCYQNYCIDFNQISHNYSHHQVVIACGLNRAQQIQDAVWPPFLKKKPIKSPYLCNRLTDFDEIWHGDALAPYSGPTIKISYF